MKTRILAAVTAAAFGAIAAPAIATAATAPACTTIHDVITKTDTGHGTPAEWADLVLHRSTKVCGTATAGYTITLTDAGRLWTRPGAGTPNGTGGQILNRVPGVVRGVYQLTATGGTLAHRHGDTSAAGSTAYVTSLFSPGTTVTGGAYAWAYATVCGEHWLDSSANNDGQGAQAGNITGKVCHKPKPTPTPTASSPSVTPSPSSSTPGEAPAPTPVRTNLPVTG